MFRSVRDLVERLDSRRQCTDGDGARELELAGPRAVAIRRAPSSSPNQTTSALSVLSASTFDEPKIDDGSFARRQTGKCDTAYVSGRLSRRLCGQPASGWAAKQRAHLLERVEIAASCARARSARRTPCSAANLADRRGRSSSAVAARAGGNDELRSLAGSRPSAKHLRRSTP